MFKALVDRILGRVSERDLERFLDDVLDVHCRLEGFPRKWGELSQASHYQEFYRRLLGGEVPAAAWDPILTPIKDRYPKAEAWSLFWLCNPDKRMPKNQAKGAQLGQRGMYGIDPLPILIALVRRNPPPETGDMLADWLRETLRGLAARPIPLPHEMLTAIRNPLRLLLDMDRADPALPLGRVQALVREMVALGAQLRQGGMANRQSSFYDLAQSLVDRYDVPLFEAGLLSQGELDTLLLEFPQQIERFGRQRPAEHAAWVAACDAAVNRFMVRLLAGDSDPHLLWLLGRYSHFKGIDHFLAACRCIELHPKEKLPVEYWGHAGDALGWVGSLLRRLPAPGPADLARVPELSAIKPETLQTATLMAPSWAPLAGPYADWPSWAKIVGWLARHGGLAPWSDGAPANQEDAEDGGAVDREALQEAFTDMGEKRFAKLLKHRIARGLYRNGLFYAEAVLGRNAADVEARFLKRDKLAVVALGMLPDEGDTLQRYLALRKFAKESRQFGAQRQASEGLAVERALANLAVTAGYDDRAQLEWSMEAQLAHELDPGRRWQAGEYTVWLDADEAATIRVEREGKQLKSVPPAVRQAEAYAEIKEAREQLQAQWDRVRRRLELAMVLGEVMDRETFAPALITPAGQAMLPHLVLRSWVAGRPEPVVAFGPAPEAERYQIVHPLDLDGLLPDWQARLIAEGKRQPFNQLFREYYTTGNLQGFRGRKVRVGTLVEKLKRRGWHTGYEGALVRRLPGRGEATFWFEDGAAYMGALEILTAGDIHLSGNASPRVISEVLRDVDMATRAAAPDQPGPVSDEVFNTRRALARAYCATVDGEYATGKGWRLHLGNGAVFDANGNAVELRNPDRKGDFPFVDPDPATADLLSRLIHLVRRT